MTALHLVFAVFIHADYLCLLLTTIFTNLPPQLSTLTDLSASSLPGSSLPSGHLSASCLPSRVFLPPREFSRDYSRKNSRISRTKSAFRAAFEFRATCAHPNTKGFAECCFAAFAFCSSQNEFTNLESFWEKQIYGDEWRAEREMNGEQGAERDEWRAERVVRVRFCPNALLMMLHGLIEQQDEIGPIDLSWKIFPQSALPICRPCHQNASFPLVFGFF